MTTAVELARWSVIALLSAVLVIASISDIRDRRIPNWTVLAAAALFVPWIFVGGEVSILGSLAGASIVFTMGLVLYALRVVGAGDSKLATATSLFVGLGQLFPFLLLVALAGGVIAVMSLASRPVHALVMFQMRGKGDFGRGVPYGVAIAIATIALLWWPSLARMLG
jgi:prepilin peptidase CpaA